MQTSTKYFGYNAVYLFHIAQLIGFINVLLHDYSVLTACHNAAL